MAERGDTVSVPDTIITDIAALKQSQSDLRRQIAEGNNITQQAIAALQGRLEGVSDLLQTVARVAERQEAHGSGLDRAFASIKEVKKHVDEIDDDNLQWRTDHVAENASVERKLSMWQGVAIGISLAASVVVGVLAWAGNSIFVDLRGDIAQERDTNKRDDSRLDRLERIEARYHQSEPSP